MYGVWSTEYEVLLYTVPSCSIFATESHDRCRLRVSEFPEQFLARISQSNNRKEPPSALRLAGKSCCERIFKAVAHRDYRQPAYCRKSNKATAVERRPLNLWLLGKQWGQKQLKHLYGARAMILDGLTR